MKKAAEIFPGFPTDYASIADRVAAVQPRRYGRSRNFIDGAVTKLSPYISRGVISTRQVFEQTLARGFDPGQIEKFIQELAWRDYWQQIWIDKADGIDADLKRPQPEVRNREMPRALLSASTGITAIDAALQELYETGYVHNHLRMYTASIACNIAGSHWLSPARWMYYHLLDADWASNALSWQWVAGANAGKKYFANQQNINKYCYSEQRGTFLDVDYSVFNQRMEIPSALKETEVPALHTNLPEADLASLQLDASKPTVVYNFYNLDPKWLEEIDANRILLLEPAHFKCWPVSQRSVDFAIALSENIPGCQLLTADFSALENLAGEIHYREHPTCTHYSGVEHPREWMFSIKGYYPSFFAFWKRCKKEIKSPQLRIAY